MITLRKKIIQKLGLQQVHFAGDEIRSLCPFHAEKNPSFSINIKTGLYFCHSCKAKGRLKSLNTDNLLLKDYSAKETIKLEPILLPKEYISCYVNSKYKIPIYLRNRSISLDVIRQFNLGFCNTGYYKNRIIIPVFEQSKLFGFISRLILADKSKSKYLYPRGFKKSHFVFNLDYCIKEKYDEIFLVEGPFDVFNLYQRGFRNVAAIFGKKIAETQLQRLCRAKIRTVNLLLDRDVSQKELYTTFNKLSLFFDSYVLSCFLSKDPGEMNEKEIEKAVVNRSKISKLDLIQYSLI